MNTLQRSPKRQGGLVLILVVVGMTSLIAMAGLALDFGLAFLTKTRIQNALDAAALSGAKALKTTGSTATASSDAQAAFAYYLGQLPRPGNTDPVPTIQYSSTLVPFSPGTPSPNFIRVRMPANYTIPTYLIGVLPSVSRTLTLSGSAVAGPVKLAPVGKICDLAPIVLYATDPADKDCGGPDFSCYGYTVGSNYELKTGETAGPGNFNLLSLGCGKGGNCLRDNLAGGAECATLAGDGYLDTETKPGEVTGPFEQGLDTRFGKYAGGLSETDYPRDIVTDTGITFPRYKQLTAAKTSSTTNPGDGVPLRRVITIVFSDFHEVEKGGRTTIPVTGFGCFFLTDRPQKKTGKDGYQYIPAEFISDCKPDGGTLSDSSLTTAGEFFKIVLYKDPDSSDS